MGSKSSIDWINAAASTVAAGFSDMGTTIVKQLTSSQLAELSPSQIASRIGDFTAAQISALSNVQIGGLSANQIASYVDSFTVSQIKSLSQGQLGGLDLVKIKDLVVKFATVIEKQLLDEINNSKNGLFAPGILLDLASIISLIGAANGFASLQGYIKQEIKDMPGLLNNITVKLSTTPSTSSTSSTSSSSSTSSTSSTNTVTSNAATSLTLDQMKSLLNNSGDISFLSLRLENVNQILSTSGLSISSEQQQLLQTIQTINSDAAGKINSTVKNWYAMTTYLKDISSTLSNYYSNQFKSLSKTLQDKYIAEKTANGGNLTSDQIKELASDLAANDPAVQSAKKSSAAYEALKKQYDDQGRITSLFNLALVANYGAEMGTGQASPAEYGLLALSATAALTTSFDKLIQDTCFDGKTLKASLANYSNAVDSFKLGKSNIQLSNTTTAINSGSGKTVSTLAGASDKNLTLTSSSSKTVPKAQVDTLKGVVKTAMASAKPKAWLSADVSKKGSALTKYFLGVAAGAYSLALAIENYDPNDSASVATLTAAVSASGSNTAKLIGSGVEAFCKNAQAIKGVALADAWTGVGDILNFAASGVLLGLAVSNYENAHSAEEKTVAICELTDASIQMAFAIAEVGVAFVPLIGGVLAEGLAVISMFVPSITGLYQVSTLAAGYQYLVDNGLTNDALAVEAAYDAAYVSTLPFMGLFSSKFTSLFNKEASQIINADIQNWFAQTETQRLKFILNSGGFTSLAQSMAQIAVSVSANAASAIYLSTDSFNYFTGTSQEVKKGMEFAAAISVDSQGNQSTKLLSSILSTSVDLSAKTTVKLTFNTSENNTQFYTFIRADGDSNLLYVDASQSQGVNIFQVTTSGVTIVGGQNSSESFWVQGGTTALSTYINVNNEQNSIHITSDGTNAAYANLSDSSKYEKVNLDNFIHGSLATTNPIIYGSTSGENVTGTLSNEIFAASTNYGLVNVSGSYALICVGTGTTVNETGTNSTLMVDMNMTGGLGLANDNGTWMTGSYASTALDFSTTDSLTGYTNGGIEITALANAIGATETITATYLNGSEGSSINAKGFSYITGSNESDTYVIGDQSSVSLASRLLGINTGTGSNIIETFDTSGSLAINLSTGNNFVELNDNTKTSISTITNSDNNIDTIVLDTNATLTASLGGTETISATDNSSMILLDIGQGTHTINTDGSGLYAYIENQNSATIIDNSMAVSGSAGTDIISFNCTDFTNVIMYINADGSVTLNSMNVSAGLTANTTTLATVVLQGDISNYYLEAGSNATTTGNTAYSVSSLLSNIASSSGTASSASILQSELTYSVARLINPSNTSPVYSISNANLIALTSNQIAALNMLQIISLSSSQVALLSTTQVAALTTTQIATLRASAVAGLTGSQISVLSSTQFAALSITQIAALSASAVSGLTSSQIGVLTTTQIAALSASAVSGLTSSQTSVLTSTQFAALSITQIAALSASAVSGLASSRISVLTTTQIAALSANAVSGLTSSQINVLTTTQIAALSAKGVSGLTSSQISALSSAQVAALTTSQIAALSASAVAGLTSSQISVLSSTQVAALSASAVVGLTSSQISVLSSTQVAALTATQIAALSTTKIAALSATKIAALSASAVAGLTISQISVLTTTQIAALSTTQIAALSAIAVACLTEAQLANCSSSQLAAFNSIAKGLSIDLHNADDTSVILGGRLGQFHIKNWGFNETVTDNVGGNTFTLHNDASAHIFGNHELIRLTGPDTAATKSLASVTSSSLNSAINQLGANTTTTNTSIDFTGNDSKLYGAIGAVFYVYGYRNTIESANSICINHDSGTSGEKITVLANGNLLIQALSSYQPCESATTLQASQLATQSTQWLTTHH